MLAAAQTGFRVKLVLLSCVYIALNGCVDAGDEAANDSVVSERPRVALITRSATDAFSRRILQTAVEHHRQYAGEYELVVSGDDVRDSAAAQVSVVEGLIDAGVEAILVVPVDEKALVHAAKKAREKGIALITLDTPLDHALLESHGLSLSHYGADRRKAAYQVGKVLTERLSIGDEVALFSGASDIPVNKFRQQGYQDAIDESGVRAVAVRQIEAEEQRVALAVDELLRESPNVKGIFCADDDVSLGVIKRLKEKGRERSVLVVGGSNSDAMNKLVRRGVLLATEDVDAYELVVLGMSAALKQLKTEKAVPSKTIPTEVVTQDWIIEHG